MNKGVHADTKHNFSKIGGAKPAAPAPAPAPEAAAPVEQPAKPAETIPAAIIVPVETKPVEATTIATTAANLLPQLSPPSRRNPMNLTQLLALN